MADDTKTMAELMADGTYRSRDEVQNLMLAIMDALFRAKGWGELHDHVGANGTGELPPEKMAEIKPLLDELLTMYGARAEEALLDQDDEQAAKKVDISNGYGALSHRPFVQAHVVGQMRPESARQAALWLMDAASSAEQDAIFLDWARDTIELPPDAAAVAMQELRGYRDKSRAEDHEEENPAEVSELRRHGVRLIDR